ncbi:MAG: hypothetical protein AAGC43_18070 [Bacteroidota bacterium]
MQLDTIEHKFYNCVQVHDFWRSVALAFRNWGIHVELDLSHVITGNTKNLLVNHGIILAKSMLQNSEIVPHIDSFKSRLKKDMEIERYAATIEGRENLFRKKWGSLVENFA